MRMLTSLASLMLIAGVASSLPMTAARARDTPPRDAASRRLAALSMTVVALDEKPIGSGRRTEWMPFEVTTNRPVATIAVEAYPPPDVTLDPIAPLHAGDRRPRVIITAAPAAADREIAVRFVLRPAEDDAAAVEVTSRLRVRAPTLTRGARWLTWLLGVVMVLVLIRLGAVLIGSSSIGGRGAS